MVSLVEGASSILLRILPRGPFLKLRNAWHKARKRAAPVMRLIYGNFTTAELIADIDAHLDRDWDILMVHSSINNLSPLHDGSAMELLKALMEYVGPDRTLVMPAFNFGDDGEGARDMLVRTGRFDLRRSPSRMGLMTELFRRSRGVVQSRHPASRVAAIGPRATDLVAGHERTPDGIGPGSPFDYMARHNAQILGIGKSFQVMTQVHHVEGLLEDEWPAPTTTLPPLPVTVVDSAGETELLLGGRQQQWRFNIWKLRSIMSHEQLREWRFHHCPMFAARAGEVTDALVNAARRGVTLYDP